MSGQPPEDGPTDRDAERTNALPSWFDALTGGKDDPHGAAAFALDSFADAIRIAPEWQLETGSTGTIALRILSHRPGERLEALAELHGAEARILLAADGSGWLSIAAFVDRREIFRALLDRPWEEYEFWPDAQAVSPRRTSEAPGRIGKRRNWINIQVSAWPQLAPLANSHGIVAAIAE